jgi:uncharacterized protein (TIGR03000 family)
MLHSILSALRIGTVAAAMLAFAATPALAQHGRGGHGGGGFHGGHGGGVNASGFHGGHVGGYHGGYYHGGYPHYGHGYYGHYAHYGRGDYGWPGFWVGAYAWPYVGSYGYYDYYPSYSYHSAPDYYAPDYNPSTVSGYYSPPDVTVVNPTSPAPAAPAADAARVMVHVPPDAQVWFDGSPTTQTGEWREYASPPLSADKTFHYDIRARWTNGDQVVDQTRSVEVRAGRLTNVDFMRP